MTHRVVFLGSPDFAVPSLRALHDDPRFDIALVVSQPDRPSGRGRRLTAPPVADFAAGHGLPLFQPASLKSDDAVTELADAAPDLLVVVAYGEILRKNVLTLARGGAINVHPSLLPNYRGASPVAAAILNGDRQTGVSIMKLVRRLDAGPVIAQESLDVAADDTTGSLTERLSEVAAAMLPDVADRWLAGDLEAAEQDESEASYTREWTKNDARIDWERPAVEIERLVRAAQPWPVAWTMLDGRRIQIRSASVVGHVHDRRGHPGSLHRESGSVRVDTGDGALTLLQVQPEGKKAVDAAGWWNGFQPGSSKRFS